MHRCSPVGGRQGYRHVGPGVGNEVCLHTEGVGVGNWGEVDIQRVSCADGLLLEVVPEGSTVGSECLYGSF